MASTYIRLPVAVVNVSNFPVSVEVSNDVGNPLPVSQTGVFNVLQAPATSLYDEVLSIASGTPVVVLSTVVVSETRLLEVQVSGTNWAKYEVQLNGTAIAKLYTYIAGGLSSKFDFRPGIEIVAGDLIEVIVEHNRPAPGDFNTTVLLQT